MPRVRPLRVPAHPRKYHDLLAWQTNGMTFPLDTYADRITELRHPTGTRFPDPPPNCRNGFRCGCYVLVSELVGGKSLDLMVMRV